MNYELSFSYMCTVFTSCGCNSSFDQSQSVVVLLGGGGGESSRAKNSWMVLSAYIITQLWK